MSISPKTFWQSTLRDTWLIISTLIVCTFILGRSYSDLKHEVQNTQVQIHSISTKMDMYAFKRTVREAAMVVVREFNKTNRVDERQVELQIQEVLDRQ